MSYGACMFTGFSRDWDRQQVSQYSTMYGMVKEWRHHHCGHEPDDWWLLVRTLQSCIFYHDSSSHWLISLKTAVVYWYSASYCQRALWTQWNQWILILNSADSYVHSVKRMELILVCPSDLVENDFGGFNRRLVKLWPRRIQLPNVVIHSCYGHSPLIRTLQASLWSCPLTI